MKKRPLVSFAVLMVVVSVEAVAAEWQFEVGPSWVSGITDVADIYEDNVSYEDPYSNYESIVSIPIGFAHTAHYQFDSGVRLGYGVGPLFVIDADASNHFEIATSLTAGYTFFPQANTSPYLFAGYALHLVKGEYVKNNNYSGTIFGVGIEFARNRRVSYVLEIARDTTEVDIEVLSEGTYYCNSYSCYDNYDNYTVEIEPIETYGTVASFRVMF